MLEKKKTVIIGFCREVSLVHAITTLLQYGYEVVAFDSLKYAPGLKVKGLKTKVVDESIEKSEENYVNFLLKLAKKFPDSILLTGDDDTGFIISKYQEQLKPHIDFLTPDFKIFNQVIDKFSLVNLTKKSALKTPFTLEISEIDNENLNFPLMIKPKIGAGGRDQIKCQSRNEIDKFIESTKNLENYFVQEYIAGPISNLFTVNIIMDKKSNPVCVFSANRINVFRSKQIPEGVTTFLKSIYLNEYIKNCIEFLKKIKWIGIAELEFKKDSRNNQLKLLEINPRLWSWTKLATISGVNFAHHYVKTLANSKNSNGNDTIFSFKEDVYYLRVLSDLYSNCYRVVIGEWSLFKFMKQNIFRIKKLFSGKLYIEKFENFKWIYCYFRKRKEYV